MHIIYLHWGIFFVLNVCQVVVITCGLLASASLHWRRNSLRFPQAMKGSSTIGFSPSSVHTWLMGSRFLKGKKKTRRWHCVTEHLSYCSIHVKGSCKANAFLENGCTCQQSSKYYQTMEEEVAWSVNVDLKEKKEEGGDQHDANLLHL